MNLPLPDPGTNLSDYQDTKVINTLDGFSLQPRLSIPFDGTIDIRTVTSDTKQTFIALRRRARPP